MVVELGEETREFFICLMIYTVGLMAVALVEIVNEVIAIVAFGANLPALVIPGLDFDAPQLPREVLGWINWIFPLSFLVPLFTATLSASAVYRVARWYAARRKIPLYPGGGNG